MIRPPQVIVGAKLPLRPMHVWAIRVRLQIAKRVRDLAKGRDVWCQNLGPKLAVAERLSEWLGSIGHQENAF